MVDLLEPICYQTGEAPLVYDTTYTPVLAMTHTLIPLCQAHTIPS